MSTTIGPQAAIFHDVKGHRFYDAINTLQWTALMNATVAATDPTMFECLAPVCANPDRQIERKKAFAVTAFLNMIAVGVNPDDIPSPCDCNGAFNCECQETLLATVFAALPVPANVQTEIDALQAQIDGFHP